MIKHKFYKIQSPKGWRIYYIKTFLNSQNIPREYELVKTDLFRHFRDGLTLFLNRQINRYLLYRLYKNVYVHVYTYNTKDLGYIEPGEWLYWQLRKADILQGGSVDKNKALKEYEHYLEEPNQIDIDTKKKAQDLQEEIMKDYYMMLRGRTSAIFGLIDNKLHRKMRKQKVVMAVRQKDGKLYKLVKRKRDTHV